MKKKTQNNNYNYGYLLKNSYGRYCFFMNNGQSIELTSGDSIELLIPDNKGVKVYKSAIEHDGNDYYAVGHKDVKLQGMLARKARA